MEKTCDNCFLEAEPSDFGLCKSCGNGTFLEDKLLTTDSDGGAEVTLDCGVIAEPIPNYAGYEQKRNEIREAWRFLRENNNTVPDDIIDLMRDAALEKMRP